MGKQVQITIDQEVYDRLQMLMVPPVNDANAAIKVLLLYQGNASKTALAAEAHVQPRSMADELRRAEMGVYDGTCT